MRGVVALAMGVMGAGARAASRDAGELGELQESGLHPGGAGTPREDLSGA